MIQPRSLVGRSSVVDTECDGFTCCNSFCFVCGVSEVLVSHVFTREGVESADGTNQGQCAEFPENVV